MTHVLFETVLALPGATNAVRPAGKATRGIIGAHGSQPRIMVGTQTNANQSRWMKENVHKSGLIHILFQHAMVHP